MVRRISVFVLLLLLWALPVHAQTIAGVRAVTVPQATLTAASASCLATNCVTLQLGGYVNIGVQVTGTCGTCTLQFEASIDGTNFVAVSMTPIGSATTATSTAVVGIWTTANLPIAVVAFRARISALTSGSFVVTLRATL